MATLFSPDDTQTIPLRPRFRIGRAPDADWRIQSSVISRDHATITWTGTSWELRDLGSQNGTFIDGERLVAGGRVTLQVGMVLAFGTGGRARIVDVEPPAPWARNERGQWIQGQTGMLSLAGADPDGDDDIHVWEEGPNLWMIDQGGRLTPTTDGAAIAQAGHTWTLHLPHRNADTTLREGEAAMFALASGQFFPRERRFIGPAGPSTLSPMEARLLQHFLTHPHRVLTHRELLVDVWGYRETVETRTIYATVNRLRQKIEPDPAQPRHLIAEAGRGYRFEPH